MSQPAAGSNPRIHPWHRPIARGVGEVQFGLLPDGPIVTGLTDIELDLLSRFDGGRPLVATFHEAAAVGVSSRRWRELVDLLTELELLEWVPTVGAGSPTGGAGRGVLVEGAGPLADDIARLLRHALHPDRVTTRTAAPGEPLMPWRNGDAGATDLAGVRPHDGRRRRRAGNRGDRDPGRDRDRDPDRGRGLVGDVGAGGPDGGRDGGRDAVRGADPGAETGAAPVEDGPALVVMVGSPALDPRRGESWWRAGCPHLPVMPNGRRTTVGPLVTAPDGPCLWCLDLHRADRDVAWPTVMAQVCAPPSTIVGPPVATAPPLDPALSHLVAGSVAAFTQAVLRGRRPPVGVSVDICLPWPRMDHRRWEVHPRCRQHGGIGDAGPGLPPPGGVGAVA